MIINVQVSSHFLLLMVIVLDGDGGSGEMKLGDKRRWTTDDVDDELQVCLHRWLAG